MHNVELRPGRGGQLARAAGASATLVKKGMRSKPLAWGVAPKHRDWPWLGRRPWVELRGIPAVAAFGDACRGALRLDLPTCRSMFGLLDV